MSKLRSPFEVGSSDSQFVSIVGFDGEAEERAKKHHRRVRRQRSLLSESLKLAPSIGSPGSVRSSLESADGDILSGESWLEDGSTLTMSCSSSCELVRTEAVDLSATQPVDIPYTRVARERIDRAEAQGKRRDMQLEVLHHVRAYLAAQGPGQAQGLAC
eukprot:jgi/Chrzof1/15102/Cz09g27070.t1